MLRRAIASVLAQTHRNIVVKVINDDPADHEVSRIVSSNDDDRISIFDPIAKRGATANFNLVFQECEADFVSLLEDDNWWEPQFLEMQIAALSFHPEAPLVVGNERVWREIAEGEWLDTGETIWPFEDVRMHRLGLDEVCGSAKICNSSMLVRVRPDRSLQTPESIPVDVTEHFRERLFGRDILLNGAPLVNYAETIRTARSSDGTTWTERQCLLIGSVFAAAQPERRMSMASALWRACPQATSPRAVSLVLAGLAISEARSILLAAPVIAVARCAVSLARRSGRIGALLDLRRRLSGEFDFLASAPLTRQMAVEAYRAEYGFGCEDIHAKF
jgi:hypothetical protein